MLNQFENWICEHIPKFEEIGYQVEVIKYPSEEKFTNINIELDSDTFIARITISQPGECYLEAIDIDSEDMMFKRHFNFEEKEQLDNEIDKMLLFLKSAVN